MIVIENRYPFLASQGKTLKRGKAKPIYPPVARWGHLVEQQGSKIIICLSTGEQITDDSKYWSGEQLVR